LKLSELISGLPLQPAALPNPGNAAVDPQIGSLHIRAQNVQPGGLFIAIRGLAADGHDFVETAVKNGAAAVVAQRRLPLPPEIALVLSQDSRADLSALAARFYGAPSEAMTLIGITGTNGKTTTSYLIEGILQAAGFSTGVIGTVNYRYAGRVFDNPVTTPESLDLQRILAEMRAAAVTHVVLEVSSHALDLHRVDHCAFDIGVFTNFSQDHLDYHQTMAAYWASKKKLFAEMLPRGPKAARAVAVVNTDDPRGAELMGLKNLRRISVGIGPSNDVRPERQQQDLSGFQGRLHTPLGPLTLRSPLVGHHNRENILCAVGAAVALELPLDSIRSGIETTSRIPGRLEPVSHRPDSNVYVDYAHTPDALENVVNSLRSVLTGKLICVFGCGGDRDRGKRPLMGRIAAGSCDLAVVTSDNPRSEPPMQIIEQVLAGVLEVAGRQYRPEELGGGVPQSGYVVEPDRRRAIALAIRAAGPKDVVLIAGKGHETYQILKDRTIHFDDREEARRVLSEIDGGRKAD
jgi:UDP-N-acetylmuramyl-tripeptide synthetase